MPSRMYSRLLCLSLLSACALADLPGGGAHSHDHSHDHGHAVQQPQPTSFSTNQISAGYNSPVPSSPSVVSSYSSVSNAAPTTTYSEPAAPAAAAPASTYSEPVEAAANEAVASYVTAAPVSTGNLYYYYYPVAAQPLYPPAPKRTYSVDNGGFSSSSLDSPLLFLLIPLVLLVLAVPVLALIGGTSLTGRSFDARSDDLDNKFGSFSELQGSIDSLIVKYMSALEAEECMERVVCELGSQASGLSHKNMMINVMEWLIGGDHLILGQGRFNVFRTAAMEEWSMNNCRDVFRCNPPKELTTPNKQAVLPKF